MNFNLVPDFRFERFSDATVEFLKEQGIEGLLLDIDNTLEPYENPRPGKEVLAWFSSLEAAGIKCAFISNNGRERVELFNKNLGYTAFYNSKKPFKKNLILALSAIGVSKERAAIMGDQVFTDVWAGRNAGIRTILLPPIKDKTDLFTKFKRLLEKPFLKKYDKRKKSE